MTDSSHSFENEANTCKVAGFAKGSKVLTNAGLIAVELLTSNSLIQSYSGELIPVSRIFTFSGSFIARDGLIRISQGVLGAISDLVIEKSQLVLLEGYLVSALFGSPNVLIQIQHLENERHVRAEIGSHILHKLILSRNCVIQVNGVWLASHWQDDSTELPFAELAGSDAAAAGECGIFIRKKGEKNARRRESAL